MKGTFTVDWARMRPPHSVIELLEIGRQFDVSPAVMLKGTDLTPEILADQYSMLNGLQEVRVIRNLQDALPGVRHLGLLAGRRNPSTYSYLGFAWKACSTVHQILETAGRFYPLTFAMTTIEADQEGGWHNARLYGGTLPEDVVEFYQWNDMASTAHFIRSVLEPEDTVRTTMPGPPMTDPDALATALDIFGEPTTFNAEVASFSIAPELVERPLRRAAPHTVALMVAECERAMAQLQASEQVSGPVRQHILATLPDGARLDDVANLLHLSARTVRRRLQSEGTNYRDLVESVRAAEAERLLRSTDLGIGQIAQRLGYENPPAFTAAFRRWHATTPSAFRARHTR